MEERTNSEWQSDTDRAYAAPSVELLGSLSELTLGVGGGCGAHTNKEKLHTDGFNNGQSGCAIS
jgi:hypothetical protein